MSIDKQENSKQLYSGEIEDADENVDPIPEEVNN
jgi:hypothetical protein